MNLTIFLFHKNGRPTWKEFQNTTKRLKSMTHFQTGQILNTPITKNDYLIWRHCGRHLSIDTQVARDQHLLDPFGPLSFGQFLSWRPLVIFCFVWPVIFYRVIENLSLAQLFLTNTVALYFFASVLDYFNNISWTRWSITARVTKPISPES